MHSFTHMPGGVSFTRRFFVVSTVAMLLFGSSTASLFAMPEGIWVREGFQLTSVVDSIKKPRFMEFDSKGVLYVSVPSTGEIKACRDDDGDGVYENVKDYYSGHDPRLVLQALEWHDGWLWFADLSAIYKSKDTDGDGKADEIVKVINEEQLNIRRGGHNWRALLIHKGRIYTSIGDQSNATDEPVDEGERKKIWTFALDGSDKKLFATGLRNTEEFVVRPGTDEIWGVDHDIDMLGMEIEGAEKPFGQPITDHNPPAELNHYVEGGFYGHPYILGMNMPNFNFLDRPDIAKLASENVVPEWLLPAHCAGNGMMFYDGQAIPGAHGDAFIAMKGSWNATIKTGYSLTRVLFEDGHPYGHQKVVHFLKDGQEILGRPADCIQAPDGSILISDDTGNRVYRLTYTGSR